MDLLEFKCLTWDLLRYISDNMDQLLAPLYEKHGITVMQVQLLLVIHRNGEETIGNLSKSMTMKSGNTSVMCKTLEKQDLIYRFRDKDDERVVKVSLSPSGEKIVQDINNYLNKKHIEYLKDEPEEDLADIINGLNKLNNLLIKISKTKY